MGEDKFGRDYMFFQVSAVLGQTMLLRVPAFHAFNNQLSPSFIKKILYFGSTEYIPIILGLERRNNVLDFQFQPK